MTEKTAYCRREGCTAPVVWLNHERTGGSAPIDLYPSGEGNIAVLDGSRYQVLAKSKLEEARAEGRPLHLNHFFTCSNPPKRKP